MLSETDIQASVSDLLSSFPPEHRCVVKIQARLGADIPALNARCSLVHFLLPGHMLLLEASYDRLIDVARLPDSCFLQQKVYGMVKHYIRPGDEEQCRSELSELCEAVREITVCTLLNSFQLPTFSSTLSHSAHS